MLQLLTSLKAFLQNLDHLLSLKTSEHHAMDSSTVKTDNCEIVPIVPPYNSHMTITLSFEQLRCDCLTLK